MNQSQAGDLNWRLSAHPITLLFFLGFRIGELILSCPELHSVLPPEMNSLLTSVSSQFRKLIDVPIWCSLYKGFVSFPDS